MPVYYFHHYYLRTFFSVNKVIKPKIETEVNNIENGVQRYQNEYKFECQYPTLFFNVIHLSQKLSLAFVSYPLTFIYLSPISQYFCFYF